MNGKVRGPNISRMQSLQLMMTACLYVMLSKPSIARLGHPHWYMGHDLSTVSIDEFQTARAPLGQRSGCHKMCTLWQPAAETSFDPAASSEILRSRHAKISQLSCALPCLALPTNI